MKIDVILSIIEVSSLKTKQYLYKIVFVLETFQWKEVCFFFQTDANNDTTDGNTTSTVNGGDAIVNTPKKNLRPTLMEQEKNKANTSNTTSSITTPPNARIPTQQNPMTPSARISALNIVSDLLRKVGVCSFYDFCILLFFYFLVYHKIIVRAFSKVVDYLSAADYTIPSTRCC